MLQVMSKAFRQEERSAPLIAKNLLTSGSQRKDALLATIFSSYANQMLTQLAVTSTYPWEKAHQWLVWLASRMSQQNQTVFMVESLQPSWLASRQQRWLYMAMTRLLLGAFTGVILWIFGLVGLQIGAKQTQSSLVLAANSSLAIGWIDLMMSIGIHCFYGLVITAVDIYFFERRLKPQNQPIAIPKWDWKRKLLLAVTVGLTAFTQLWLWGEDPTLLVLQVMGTVFIFVLFSQFAFGQQYKNDVGTVETLGWSWQASMKGALPTTLFTIIPRLCSQTQSRRPALEAQIQG
jgi:hypothetical protein